jgi:hypothetical protein
LCRESRAYGAIRNEAEIDIMGLSAGDGETLRGLAGRYSEIANLEVQRERAERYRQTNALERVRPLVLIFEVPWGEIRDETLRNTCAPELGWLESRLRQTIYQWENFQCDMVVPPVFGVHKKHRSSGIGLEVHDKQIKGDTGAHITAHQYEDQLKTEADVEKLRIPELTYLREETEAAVAVAAEVFDGLMEVHAIGNAFYYNMWDIIARYRGVDSLLMDLAMQPELIRRIAQRFYEIGEATFRQMEELGLLESETPEIHCTAGYARELPADDFSGKVRRKDVWGRGAAQIFGSVSPAMHDEFDLVYAEKLFAECGLLYYGCCEPLDGKIDILRKRFPNLRKVSITPWADPDRAAANIGHDFVMACKPNPALVASATFNPEPAEKEMVRYLEACKREGTTCEFVLKDISTISNRPQNLTAWAETARRAIDRVWE